ncbi:MAG: 4-(cytidine 5'-diphospho)-2-C-methyl-D-erythritol kinase [Proteobacteria bacterium]|nr:4-(cytidine 5'-diphospho)-2-C-methyl-D-erythritol kinase [Pseudomonadota bacterium]
MKILSPAKINLMLRVLGRRTDGYHLLQTYFQLLDWGDYMQFAIATTNSIKITGQFNNLPQADNLIYQAAKHLEPFKQIAQGVVIKVEKNIPQGSGLGGGSSNAATTLRVLNKLWQCNLAPSALHKIAIELGADVPVFMLNKSAMATGIGEKLQTIAIDTGYFVLLFPQVSIATADVFADKTLNRNQQTINPQTINDKNTWTNACLTPVLNKYPQVRSIYAEASKYTNIYMSGTGSTLFASFETKIHAHEFLQSCPIEWNAKLCQAK